MKQHDLQSLKQAILSSLSELLRLLHPNRHIEASRSEIRIGNRGSLCIDRRNGNFFDHESGIGGDLIDLVRHTLATDFKGAVVWLENYLGNQPTPIPSQDIPKVRKERQQHSKQRIDKAVRIWQEARPLC